MSHLPIGRRHLHAHSTQAHRDTRPNTHTRAHSHTQARARVRAQTHTDRQTHTHTHKHTHTQCRPHTRAANTRNNPAQIHLRAASQAARFCSARKPLPGESTPRTQACCSQKSRWRGEGATFKETDPHWVQAGLTHGADPFGWLGISRWIPGPSPDVSSGWIALPCPRRWDYTVDPQENAGGSPTPTPITELPPLR